MSEKGKKITLFIDGASQGNPGHAGIGVVITDERGKIFKKISEYIGKTTNNVAEYVALNIALIESLISHYKNISINSDSELLVRQINGLYKVKSDNIKNLFLQSCYLIKAFEKIKINHVRRCNNKEADKLANLAIKKKRK